MTHKLLEISKFFVPSGEMVALTHAPNLLLQKLLSLFALQAVLLNASGQCTHCSEK